MTTHDWHQVRREMQRDSVMMNSRTTLKIDLQLHQASYAVHVSATVSIEAAGLCAPRCFSGPGFFCLRLFIPMCFRTVFLEYVFCSSFFSPFYQQLDSSRLAVSLSSLVSTDHKNIVDVNKTLFGRFSSFHLTDLNNYHISLHPSCGHINLIYLVRCFVNDVFDEPKKAFLKFKTLEAALWSDYIKSEEVLGRNYARGTIRLLLEKICCSFVFFFFAQRHSCASAA